MRLQSSALAILVAASACVEMTTATPEPPPTFRLTAQVTASNHCNVSALGKSYSSIGQVRGDVPSQFIGTVAGKSYHGFGCWVATAGGDGDLVIVFSRNNLGKPLATGTYVPASDILDETPAGFARVEFRPSELGGDYLRTMNGAAGSIVVESDASGGRRITVDVDVVRWGPVF